MTTIAIYPGTFDPITKGHMDVIKRASRITSKLIVAVADDIPKTPIFSVEERVKMAQADIAACLPDSDIEVIGFTGLLIDFAKSQQADIIIRGLRAVSDFEYEFQLAAMNARLDTTIQTIFLPASESSQFIASRLVKEIARLGGDISGFVSADVETALKKHYR